MTNVKEIERVGYIDYLRFIGIILMVLAHIPLSEGFVHYVHGFHMPLFFVISGFLFELKGRKIKLFETIKKLIIPYFSFSMAAYVLWLLEMHPTNIHAAMEPLYAVFWVNSEGMPIAGALWFLTAMIFLNIFVFVIEYITKNYLKTFIVILITILGLLETKILPYRCPWSIGAASVGVGYFYIGTLLKKIWNTSIFEKVKKLPLLCYVFILCLVGVFIMNNGILNMRKGEYAFTVITLANSIIYIVVLWLTVYRLYPIIDNKLNRNIKNPIKEIGHFSVIYLCCNECIINLVWSVMAKLGYYNKFIEIILVILFLKVCELLFTKTFLKIFVGMK